MPKPRRVLIAGNWKMNHGPRETTEFFHKLGQAAGALGADERAALSAERVQAIVFPPYLSIERALHATSTAGFPVGVGAQNGHWEKSGAFTGEVSGGMLLEAGVKWALVGHSERRQYFGETDETVRKRATALLGAGLRVILCIGETRAEREGGQTTAVLTRQIAGGLSDEMRVYLDGRLVLAYEPVWAIGTGLTATPQQAEEAHQTIRKLLWDRFGMDASARTPILYGGSVTPENIETLLACPNVDGGLVGGASLKPESYLALVRAGARESL